MGQYTNSIADARAAVKAAAAAEDLRKELRWTADPADPERQRRIEDAILALDVAMRPVRAALGSLAWHPAPPKVESSLRAASAEVQYQRKQLKKMRR